MVGNMTAFNAHILACASLANFHAVLRQAKFFSQLFEIYLHVQEIPLLYSRSRKFRKLESGFVLWRKNEP